MNLFSYSAYALRKQKNSQNNDNKKQKRIAHTFI